MNILKKVCGWVKEKVSAYGTKVAAVGVGLFATASAKAQTFDPSATLTTNQGKIDDIYQWVVGIIIGMALVTVGSRFFKRAK